MGYGSFLGILDTILSSPQLNEQDKRDIILRAIQQVKTTFAENFIDSTLSQPDKAADAKAVGDEINQLEIDLNNNFENFIDNTLSQSNKAADAKAVGDKINQLRDTLQSLSIEEIRDLVDNLENFIDDTLSKSGKAADAKSVGDKINQLEKEASNFVVNLFNPVMDTKTVNGITYTFDDENNTYMITGTASANVYEILNTVTLDPGTYKLLGLTKNGSTTTFRINLYNNDPNNLILITRDTGEGAIFTITKTETCRLVLYINSGTTVNMLFKPMITPNLNATINDYVPYTGKANTINKNIALLRYDLYKSMLTGDKIHNNNVGWMVDLAKTWTDNASKIWYSYEGNLFQDEVIITGNKYPMSCSVFTCAMIFGISYYNSKYNGKSINTANSYAYHDDILMKKLKDVFASELLLPYFIKKGYAFVPEPDLSNIEMGDILFFNEGTSTMAFKNVSHTAIFAYKTGTSQYKIWEVGDNRGPVESIYGSSKMSHLVFAVRVPYTSNQINNRKITLQSGTDFKGPVLLSSLFNFVLNGKGNMWKVMLLGTAYAAGGDASSIYLIRTNATGAITGKTALFEGSSNAVRKLDSNYRIIDASGAYNLPVTITVEWIGD